MKEGEPGKEAIVHLMNRFTLNMYMYMYMQISHMYIHVHVYCTSFIHEG